MREEYDFSEGIRGKFFDDAGPRFPASSEESDWSGPSEQLGEFITEQVKKTLDAYQSQPTLIREHANTEQDAFMGGYARRQLFELVQNSADALSEAPEGESILVRMTKEYLYCADNGTAIDEDGVRALMFHNVSGKRSTSQIGKFGRGFKSVLGVTDAPEFYSHSVSFRFDRTRARQRIAKIASNKHNPEHCPVLRFPEPFDPDESIGTDKDLEELMSWATNIVRLPLKSGVREDLVQQFQDFPPEFMLFVEHVRHLTLEHEDESRSFMLSRCDSEIRLDTGNERRHWRKFDIRHRLSPQARQDWHLSGEDVLISWAAPLDRLDRPGHFWAHFPTENPSLVAGILNAQWKLSEDRLNLLPGVYNKELIIATAEMIVEKLPELVSNDDPARHLDALPRREESGDGDLVRKLRDRLFSLLEGRDIVPDQDCNLQMIGDISYPPKELKGCDDALKRWSDYAGRPRKWLHHKALTRNRLAAIDRLFDNNRSSHHFLHTHHGPSAPRAEISQWLEALVDYHRQPDEIAEASIAAVQTAALIPKEKRSERLGKIILTAAGTLVKPNDQEIFLPSENRFNREQSTDPESCVHPDLISDSETLEALKKIGLTEPSPESRLDAIVHRILRQNDCDQEVYEALHEEFWLASRDLSREDVERIIGSAGNLIKKLRVRTQAGTWLPTFSVLRPGKIIPDDRRDRGFTVDSQFHESDDALLCKFGVTEAPDKRDLSREPEFETYLKVCKYRFREKAFKETGKKPHESLLKFETCDGCGPLDILKRLSDEGRVAYTNELLSQDTTFTPWTMRHKTQDKYSKLAFNCLSIHALRNYGRIKTASGQIVPFEDALDPTPRCPEARDELLKHPMADKIKEAFDLADPIPEFLGEGDAIPLTDCWPGLNDHLPPHLNRCRIIPCEQIRVLGESRECIFYSRDIYFRGAVDNEERHMLRSVVDE
ncbi:MAG: hypothetical protein OXC91_01300, partial [Rhodobacteraceae bacterium]|nr:hypothetical protein [Paracoccaceae bacterium]